MEGMGLYLILSIPALLLGMFAQARVKSAYAKWSAVANRRGMTGADAAESMLAREGVRDVVIEPVDGFLTDHYDPAAKVLRLSPEVFSGRSVAALGIACHEAGHALQHANGYGALTLRSWLVPTAKIGSWLAVPLIGIGFAMGQLGLAKIGVLLFGLIVLFQLVTLPVEFNASSRAKQALTNNGVTVPDEDDGVGEVLNAAALTYVAAAVSAISQLLYYVMIIAGNSRNRE